MINSKRNQSKDNAKAQRGIITLFVFVAVVTIFGLGVSVGQFLA